ncbi:MAG: serine/threonine-protein kinase [Pyrinomonadaceae bacterium]
MSTSSKTESVLAVDALVPGTILQSRYRIVRQLGKGGMGAVYEAIDQRLGITVALKETVSLEASVRKQFEQEARLLASLQHPALPRVSDHFAEGERAFLVMQFIAGVDLARIIYQQPGPFPREQVVAWADQLLDALIYLHSQQRQVIHRDIKPHNLKLTASGQIALLDFGLAKAQPAEASTTSSASFFGYTRQYSPLEQIQALSTGPHSDIYALGATLYHLLTGVRPADALTRAAASANGQGDPLKPANLVHPGVGAEIATILTKAMAQNPELRYRSAAEFREALRRVGRRAPNRQRYQPYPAGSVLFSEVADDLEMFQTFHKSTSRKSNPAFITSVVLMLLVAAAGLFYGFPQWRKPPVAAPNSEPALRPAGRRPPEKVSVTNATRFSSNRGIDVFRSGAPKSAETAERRSRQERNASSSNAVAEQVQRLESVKLASPESTPRTPVLETKIEPSRQIRIPNIRLPAAEVPGSDAVPSAKPRLLETYHPTSPTVSSFSTRKP